MSRAEKKDAMETALRYLEHRARTEQEVRGRLTDAEYEAAEIDECLQRLKDLHYVDDTEYALSYLRRSLEKRRGRMRYFRELKERGISRDTALQAIYEYEDEENADLSAIEYTNAEEEAGRILAGRELNDREKARAARRLASLGYETSLIYAVIGRIGRETI